MSTHGQNNYVATKRSALPSWTGVFLSDTSKLIPNPQYVQSGDALLLVAPDNCRVPTTHIFLVHHFSFDNGNYILTPQLSSLQFYIFSSEAGGTITRQNLRFLHNLTPPYSLTYLCILWLMLLYFFNVNHMYCLD